MEAGLYGHSDESSSEFIDPITQLIRKKRMSIQIALQFRIDSGNDDILVCVGRAEATVIEVFPAALETTTKLVVAEGAAVTLGDDVNEGEGTAEVV